MSRARRLSSEVREKTVRMVRDHTKGHATRWAAIQSIVEKLGCLVATLRRWVRDDERNPAERPG